MSETTKKRYLVHLRAMVSKDVDVEAESPEEAVRLAAERGWDSDGATEKVRRASRPEYVETDDDTPEGVWDVAGTCETCCAWLLDGDDGVKRYLSDGDGYRTCVACAEPKSTGRDE